MAKVWNRLVLKGTVGFFKAWSLLRKPAPLPKMPKWRRILIYQNSALGDALYATPAIRAVRTSFPEAHLALLCRDRHADLMAQNPHLDQLLVYRGKAKSFRLLTAQMKATRFDVAVVLHGNDPETLPYLWTGRVGHIVGPANTALGFLYSLALPAARQDQHVVDHRLMLVGAIGAQPQGRYLEQPLPQEVLLQASDLLARELPGNGPVLALAPGASSPHKMWPLERFAALAQSFIQSHGARIAILTTGKEKPLALAIQERLAGPSWASNGRIGLLQVAGVIASSDLVLANDSGLYNLGQALNRPTLALGGPQGPVDYGPLPDHRAEMISLRQEVCDRQPCLNTLCPDSTCIQAITVQMVEERVARMLDEDAGARAPKI